jgi:SMI1-KNR4 cell-wall
MHESFRTFVSSLPRAVGFRPGATDPELDEAPRRLQLQMPGDLRWPLTETDGLTAEHGVALVWQLERIVVDNLSFRANPDFRELYLPFDHLLFFADTGTGDQFAFAICAGEVRRPDIYAWNHEDDSRTWVAPGLTVFLDWWFSGTLKV